jgi:chitinase
VPAASLSTGTGTGTGTGSDTTAPSIGISSPYNNSTVSGLVTVTNVVSDNVGVVKVELYVDNVLTATTTSAPWTLTWNTSNVAAGSHVLLSKAYDAAGNTAGAVVSVTLAATVPSPDTIAPTIGISFPYNNSTVSGVVTVTNVASDNVGVVKVELYVDSVLTATTTSAPWSLTWDTALVSHKNHVLLTKAYDAAGNTGGAVINVKR